MPSTDTIASSDLLTASANLTLTSAAWNTHAAIWRGHLLPVDASTSAAANDAYDLGSSTYKWKDLYLNRSLRQTISSTTGAFSFGSQHMVLCNANGGAFAVTLPAAASFQGVSIALKKTDSSFNVVTVDGNGSETIDSTTTTYLSTENECLYLISDGTNWQKKHRYIDGKINTFTPTGTWVTNVVYSGRWWREKNFCWCIIDLSVTGAVTAADLYINPPSGLTIDTTKIPNFTLAGHMYDMGSGVHRDAGVAYYEAVCGIYNTTGSIWIGMKYASGTYVYRSMTTNTVPFTWASGDHAQYIYRFPVTNWES